jgi:signal transduction histidine kinase
MNIDTLTNLDLLSVAITTASIGILGFTVYFNNRRGITNKSFLFCAVITILYSLANYFQYQILEVSTAFWILKLTIFFAVWHAFSFFNLFYVFPEESLVFSKSYRYLLLPITALVSLTALTPLVFNKVLEVSPSGSISKVENGPAIALFGIFVMSLVISGIVVLIKKTIKAKGEQRKPFKFVALGAFITFSLILVFNFIFPAILDNSRFVPLAPVFFFPFVALTSYSIIKHRLFHLRLAAISIISFLVTIFSFANIIFSNTISAVIMNSTAFVIILIGSIELIRLMIREDEQKEALAIANAKLRELDELKSQFLSFASHQLRAPLTAIEGYTSMLLEGDFGEMTDKVKESIQTIDGSSKSLVKVVNEFLDVSRIEQGRMKYEFTDFDVEKLAEEVVTELRPNVENKGLAFKFKSEPNQNYLINGDSGKIKQVIGNLLDNSIKYTPTGSIEVHVGRKTGKILISIIDTGIGIKSEDMPKLFSMFTRARDASKTNVSGTGLGLYVAKQMIEANHGRVWVESAGVGHGSTFLIELPAKA